MNYIYIYRVQNCVFMNLSRLSCWPKVKVHRYYGGNLPCVFEKEAEGL
jgi:hypothetical protein